MAYSSMLKGGGTGKRVWAALFELETIASSVRMYLSISKLVASSILWLES